MKALVTIGAIAASAALLGTNLAEKVMPQSENVAVARPLEPASAAGARIVALRADRRGHFASDIIVNGQFVTALVDTGASTIAFSAEDARKLKIEPKPGDYTQQMQTANGVVRAAKVRIAEVRLQSITVRDVEATVMPPGALSVTLLGMSFLRRLTSFEMQGNTLVLKQ